MTFNHKYLRTLFKLLVLAACAYYLARCGVRLDPAQLRPVYVPVAAAAGVLYFVCTLLMAQAWRWILLSFHPVPIPFAPLAIVYFRSALAKYIPSNVMHYAARHYMCRRFSISQKAVLAGNLFEIAAVLAAALTLLAIFIVVEPAFLPTTIRADRLLLRVAVVIVGAGILATLIAVLRRKTKKLDAARFSLKGIAAAYALDIVFLPLTGLVLCGLFWGMRTDVVFDSALVARIVFGYICAWTLGFVTPGAPGGLGVREAVMTAVLGPTLGHDIALLGALLFRLCTLFGELLGYLFARFLEYRYPSPQDIESIA